MGHYKSNVRDLEFNLFEVLDLEKVLATGEFGDLDGDSVREMLDEVARLAEGPVAESFADADRHPPTFDPETHTRHACPSRSRSRCGRGSKASGGASGSTRTSAVCPRRRWWRGRSTRWCSAPTRGVHVPGRTVMANILYGDRQRAAEGIGRAGDRAQLGRDDGADRTRRRLRRRRRPHQGHRSSPTAPGTSTASSGSSPAATPTTLSRTSCTWCWPGPRAQDRAPRG